MMRVEEVVQEKENSRKLVNRQPAWPELVSAFVSLLAASSFSLSYMDLALLRLLDEFGARERTLASPVVAVALRLGLQDGCHVIVSQSA